MYEDAPGHALPGQPQPWPPAPHGSAQQPLREVPYLVVGGLACLVLICVYFLQHLLRLAYDVSSGDFHSYRVGWYLALGALSYVAIGGASVWSAVRILMGDVLGRWAAIAVAGAFGAASLVHHDAGTSTVVTVLTVLVCPAIVAVSVFIPAAWVGHRQRLLGSMPLTVGLSRLLTWAGAASATLAGVGLFPLGTERGRFFVQAFLLVGLGVAVFVLSLNLRPGQGQLTFVIMGLLSAAGVVGVIDPGPQWAYFPLMSSLGLVYPLVLAPESRRYFGLNPLNLSAAAPSTPTWQGQVPGYPAPGGYPPSGGYASPTAGGYAAPPAPGYAPPVAGGYAMPPAATPAPTGFQAPPVGQTPIVGPPPPVGQMPLPPGAVLPPPPRAAQQPPPPVGAVPLPSPPPTGVPFPVPPAPAIESFTEDVPTVDIDEATVARPSKIGLSPTAVIRLRVNGRTDITIDEPVILGRKPTPTGDLPAARCEVVPDPSKSLSRSHVLVSPGEHPGEVEVLDLGSTNGTWIIDGDATSHRAHSGNAVIATEGNSLLLGDDIELKVVR